MEKEIVRLSRKSTSHTHLRPTRILQFGEGNFLRAFVDWMVNEMNNKSDFDTGIKIIQPLPTGLSDLINQQDGLYHVLLNGYSGDQFIEERILIDAVREAINPYKQFKKFIKEAENQNLKFIISNTTEAGITLDESDSFDFQPAQSFPGKLLQILYHRYQTLPDSEPIYVLPCELIENNGDKLKEVLITLATKWKLGEYFLTWLHEKVFFYNTLVDRIVPGYPKEKAEQIHGELGYTDQLLVEGEFFHLWVIEGPTEIKNHLPAQEANLNVIFTEDLSSYRNQKVRILNGLHTVMVPLGLFAGISTVKESVEERAIGKFLTNTLREEIIPSLDGDAEALLSYAEEIIRRFKNPSIRHELMTISLNSFSKFKTRVLPSIVDLHAKKDYLATHLLFSLACLIRFYKGEWNGATLPIKDDPYVLDKMKTLWSTNDILNIAHEVLSDKKLWDQDLTKIDGLEAMVSNYLEELDSCEFIGILETLLK